MTTFRHSLLAAATTALALCLAPGVQAQSTPTKASASAWVSAPQKHNGSGLSLRYLVPKSLPVGAAAPVKVELSAARGAAATTVFIDVPDGVTVRLNGQPLAGSFALLPGERRVLTLDVTGREDGLRSLMVRTERDGLGSVQGVALPFGSGAVALKPHGEVRTQPSGEKVISLPAK